MNGSLNIYFPGQIKNRGAIMRFCKKWNRVRERQLRYLHNGHRPLSDLLDLAVIRLENNHLLNGLRESIHLYGSSLGMYPYATECMRMEYEYSRESKIHSKEINVILSKIQVLINGITNDERPINGILQMHVNADNKISTFVLSLSFTDFSCKKIIKLKHCFYKRFEVKIKEFTHSSTSNTCNGGVYGCIHSISDKIDAKYRNTTFQEFVYRHLPFKLSDVDNEFDFRARYSMLEIWGGCLSNKNKKYGILMADEGFQNVPSKRVRQVISCKHDLSKRNSFELYYQGLNALIVNNKHLCNKKYFTGLNPPSYHHEYHQYNCSPKGPCIAGINKNIYPKFLKGVEIHYMVNMAYTDDIEVRDQSYMRPWVFLKRARKLWKILYEVDLHNSHNDKDIWDSFGIGKRLDRIRTEYNAILTHTIGYFTFVFTFVMLVATILQLCK